MDATASIKLKRHPRFDHRAIDKCDPGTRSGASRQLVQHLPNDSQRVEEVW
jgi:hypothetical protein